MEVIPSEVRDRDSGKKAKAKVYADKKRNAKESDIGPGDKVLVNKNGRTICLHHLQLNRILTQLKRCYQNGQQCCYWITHGVQLKRNNTHVKKYEERIVGQDQKTTLLVDLEPTESSTEQETAKFPFIYC